MGHQNYVGMKFCNDYPDAFKYPYKTESLHWDVFVQQHGGLVCKEMAKSYSKGVSVACPKPLLLNILDRIHTKPVS